MDKDIVFENMWIQILVLSLLLFWLIYLYFVKNYGYWEHLHIPHVPGVFPWGSLSEGLVFSRVHIAIAYDEFYKLFRGDRFYGIIHIRSPCLVIRDPDLIQRILTKDSEFFSDRTILQYNVEEYMLKNLFTMKGDEWKVRRKKLMPAYNSAKMKLIFFLLEKTSTLLKNHVHNLVQKSDEVDVRDIVTCYVLEALINCTFGMDTKTYSSEMTELSKIIPLVFRWDLSVVQKSFMFNAFPIFKKFNWTRFEFIKPYFKELLTNVVCKVVDYREENDLLRYDFLDLLIKIRQNKMCLEDEYQIKRQGKMESLTNKEIAGEVLGFMSCSYEKSSSVIVFCLYQLSINPHIQEKLYLQVNEVMARYNGLMSYQAIEEMTYMDKVVNETMRMYPPLPSLQRTCTMDYNVPNSNLVISEDIRVLVPTYSLHHDPDYFPDPETFDPERFSDENKSKRHPFVFLPYGAGPHKCMGMHFAEMQIKAGLATIINDFEVNLSPKTKVPVAFKGKTFVLEPDSPLRLLLRRRKAN